MAPDSTYYRVEHPPRQRMNYWRFGWSDGKFAIGWLACLVTLQLLVGGPVWAVVLILAIVGLFKNQDGRFYYLPGELYRSLKVGVLNRGVLWQAVPKAYKGLRGRLLSTPEKVIPLKLDVLEGTDVALIYNPAENTDSMVVMGSGSRLASQSFEEQQDTYARVADAITKVAAQLNARTRLSLVLRHRPTNPVELRKFYALALDARVAFAPTDLSPEEVAALPPLERRNISLAKRLLDECSVVQYKYAARLDMAVVVTIDRDPAVARVARQLNGEGGKKSHRKRLSRQRGIAKPRIRRLNINRLTQVVIDELRACGVYDPHALGPNELHEFIRTGWDINGSTEYFEWQENPEDTDGTPLPRSDFWRARNLWPQESITTPYDHCTTDGTYHAIIRIKRMPSRLGALDFRQLFSMLPVWSTFSLNGETVRSNTEYHVNERKLLIRDDIRRGFGPPRIGAAARMRDAERERRQEILAENPFKFDYAMLISISSLNREDLDEEVDRVIAELRTLGITGARVKGMDRQLNYLLAATLGTNTV